MHDLIIIIVLIILNGVFSMSEVALPLDHTDWNHSDRYSHRSVLRSNYCFRSR